LLALMLMARAVTAQGFAISGQALSSSGTPASYATVRVCPYTASGIPCSPTSSLWSDLALTQSISNPYTTDQVGNYTFFVTCGSTYIVQIAVGSGVTYSYFESAACVGSSNAVVPAAQVPSGLVNGTNTVFTLSSTPVGGSVVFQKNGQVLTGYSISGATITLARAPVSTDTLYVNYFVSSSSSSYSPNAETPGGVINGTNTAFTLTYTPVGTSLLLQYNGQILEPNVGYTLSGNTVTLTKAPVTGDVLYANYFH
jgi:hypothetical protein